MHRWAEGRPEICYCERLRDERKPLEPWSLTVNKKRLERRQRQSHTDRMGPDDYGESVLRGTVQVPVPKH